MEFFTASLRTKFLTEIKKFWGAVLCLFWSFINKFNNFLFLVFADLLRNLRSVANVPEKDAI